MSFPKEISPIILRQIEQAIRSIKYGRVQIAVHNSQVVQIDKIERIRLTAQSEAKQ